MNILTSNNSKMFIRNYKMCVNKRNIKTMKTLTYSKNVNKYKRSSINKFSKKIKITKCKKLNYKKP